MPVLDSFFVVAVGALFVSHSTLTEDASFVSLSDNPYSAAHFIDETQAQDVADLTDGTLLLAFLTIND